MNLLDDSASQLVQTRNITSVFFVFLTLRVSRPGNLYRYTGRRKSWSKICKKFPSIILLLPLLPPPQTKPVLYTNAHAQPHNYYAVQWEFYAIHTFTVCSWHCQSCSIWLHPFLACALLNSPFSPPCYRMYVLFCIQRCINQVYLTVYLPKIWNAWCYFLIVLDHS